MDNNDNIGPPASTLLKSYHREKLSQWIGCWPQLTLLWKNSVHAGGNINFHAQCDNKGPTITVVRMADRIFGGVTSVSWNSTNSPRCDPYAFLFVIFDDKARNPIKFPSKKTVFSVFSGDNNWGPTFGQNGQNLDLFLNLANLPLSSSNIGVHYDLPNGETANTVLAGSPVNWNIIDIEIFTADIVISPASIPMPWRDFKWDNVVTQRRSIELWKPRRNPELKRVNILLIGKVGAGKSAYLNTLLSSVRGERDETHISSSNYSSGASITTELTKQSLGGSAPVHIWDTWGWDDNAYTHGEFTFMLQGNLKSGWKMSDLVSDENPNYNATPKLEDKVHVLVILIPTIAINAAYINKLKFFYEEANKRKISVKLLLTMVDKTDLKLVKEGIKGIFLSQTTYNLICQLGDATGINRHDILPMKSYSDVFDIVNNPYIDGLALFAIEECLRAANAYFERKYNEINHF